MPEENAELRRRRARQHVDEREPFDELRFADPLPALLELGLHHADDRGSAVGRQADLEEAGQDLTHRASPPRRHGDPPTSGLRADSSHVLCILSLLPMAFMPEWPLFMYFASKPASRSLMAVLQPTWKP